MKMLKWLSILLLTTLTVAAQTVNPTYKLEDYGMRATYLNKIVLTPLSPVVGYNGFIQLTNDIAAQGLRQGTNQYTFTNIFSGYSYLVRGETPLGSFSFTNCFPVGLTGAVNASVYMCSSNNLNMFTANVLVDGGDTTPGPLASKLVAGSNITITTNGVDGNESLTITSTGGGGGSSALYGNGSPAGIVSATPGTSYLDTNLASFYLKTNGSGSSGWFWMIQGHK